MSEEELNPPAAGKTKVERLEDEIDGYRGQIGKLAGEITKFINDTFDPKKKADKANLNTAILALQKQQAKYEALMKDAQDKLAKIEGKTTMLGAESQSTEPDWLRKAFEKLTLKVDESSRKFDNTARELTEKVESTTLVLPKTLTDNLGKMLFAVLDKNANDGVTRNPVGVSFFVRPQLAITAYHVLSEHYPGINLDDKVYLLREAGLFANWSNDEEEMVDRPNLIETTLVKFDAKEDWALMKLCNPTNNIIQFEIANAATLRRATCQVLSYNIGLSAPSAENDMSSYIVNPRQRLMTLR